MNKLTPYILGGLLAIGGYETIAPNSALSHKITKAFCSETTAENPTTVQLADYITKDSLYEGFGSEFRSNTSTEINLNQKIDRGLTQLRTGDRLKFGKLELHALDGRPQTGKLEGGNIGHYRMGCPGYTEFNVEYEGKEVPGGKGIKLVHASPTLGGGGPFDGWPSYTLGDVLDMTDLSADQKNQILREGTPLAEQYLVEKKARR